MKIIFSYIKDMSEMSMASRGGDWREAAAKKARGLGAGGDATEGRV